jgi:hypothetical protein
MAYAMAEARARAYAWRRVMRLERGFLPRYFSSIPLVLGVTPA